MALDRFFGCAFGEGKRHYYPVTNEGLEEALNTASAIKATGIELRFEGERERRGRTILPVGELVTDEIGKTIDKINRLGFLTNLHLSEYYFIPDVFDQLEDVFKKVNLIILHPHYGKAFLKQVEDRRLNKILDLPLEERDKYRYNPPELIPESLREKILIENGNRYDSTLSRIAQFADDYKLNIIFDIGHFVQCFYKKHKYEKKKDNKVTEIERKIDDIRRYIQYDEKTATLKEKLINYLGPRIIHAHVHGIRKWSSGEVHTHYPFDESAILTQHQAWVLTGLLKKSKLRSYAIEVWRGDKKERVQKMIETAENFEDIYKAAKKTKFPVEFPSESSKLYKAFPGK